MVLERFPGALSPPLIPIIFGLAVATMIYSLGHISGAHFNPAVTLGFALSRHFRLKELPSYWIAQFLGAILALALLYYLLPSGILYGATIPNTNSLAALAWECILSFFLMFVISAVATDTRAVGIMAGAAIGAIVTLAAYIGGPVTGAAINPARALAPALFQGSLGSIWIYFAGPFLGCALGALTYEKIRCKLPTPADTPDKKPGGCC